ncbi:peptidase M23 [Mucilaginibacter limnophilus]|uniref:Peptidase M23 n=1 Tax=Mucilaginibacter limnophilus TaxID=1932778 RepID=A0A3S2UMH1_9SPHI|nr:peptidoglycan DD-metalloendopeptidase family protein [Mucilaginibacter limnophilus]RVU01979.1 peptidase M23 [Mucilaginibacter limnophilus]
MDASELLVQHLQKYPLRVSKVVDIKPDDCLLHMDLTAGNSELNPQLLKDVQAFDGWVTKKLNDSGCRYGVGGYMENRVIYASREHFDTDAEPRSIHLGVDIWAAAGTPVYTPLDGIVHSFLDNDNFGDYGPTIVLQHDIAGLTLYSLYGHLNRASLNNLTVGQKVNSGQHIASFGNLDENGNWPPHLHFQLMLDMEGKKGDYPGVCRPSEKGRYLKNVPDPDILLQINNRL